METKRTLALFTFEGIMGSTCCSLFVGNTVKGCWNIAEFGKELYKWAFVELACVGGLARFLQSQDVALLSILVNKLTAGRVLQLCYKDIILKEHTN